MKKIFVLLLAMLMLLGGCGAPADTTADNERIDAPETDAPVTNSPETDAPVTNAPETAAPETEPVVMREDYTVAVKGDTYVLNKNGEGDQSNNNFGAETEIHVKNNPGSLTRFGYLKFDISELAGDNSFTSVELDICLKAKQKDAGNPPNAVVEIYAAEVAGWDESTLTFNTQPAIYDLITSRNDLNKEGEVYSFPITAYVKYALENGQTEIALYIKEATEVALHLKFASKEAGEKAPKLSVYHGTKVDEGTYGKQNVEVKAELSKAGLDTFVGLKTAESNSIKVIEDTYVEAGSSADINFGSAEELDFKAMYSKVNNYYRITLVKFDISSLEQSNSNSVVLQLNCTVMEDMNDPTRINVYSCYPYDWNEMSVTYNTLPEREDLVTSMVVTGTGVLRIDVTDYIRRCINRGDKLVSFYLEGDSDSVRRLKFSSRESEFAVPALVVSDGSAEFTTVLKYDGINPWDYAMENVSDWLHRWEIIKQGGDSSAELIERIDSEYSLSVGASKAPNGEKTQYTDYPTRNIATLNGFTANANESAMYDIYGGFMDESMRQEATGFFYTTKIGDRWWTIDPLGYPFFRVACVGISVGNAKQKTAMLSKYGTLSGWSQGTTDKLKDLGFNAAGGWSSTGNLSIVNEPIAQTEILYVLKKYCQSKDLDISKGGSTTLLHETLPVFDPEFITSADATVKKGVAGYQNKSYMYGWMSDNELPQTTRMLDNALMLDTEDERFAYSYATAWTFLYLKTGKTNLSLSDITEELRLEYRAMVYDRYFKVVTAALERYVPTHQYMGCRFLAQCYSDEYVMRVAGYYCDVISYNYYGVWEGEPELLANQQKWAGKPVIITEWYTKGMDVWEKDNRMTNASGAGWVVKNQDDRGKFYQNYALQLLECKGCVGFDWFKYHDNDPEDLSADESNRDSNKGIYDNEANEYTDLTKYMGELNNQKYTLIKFFDAR